MSNRQPALRIKWKPYQKYGFGVVMLVCLVLLFCSNILNVRNLTIANIATSQANAQYQKAQWGDAEIGYKKAIQNAPDSNSARYNLGNSYYQQGRYSEALTIFLKVRKNKNDSHSLAAWNNLGNTYYKLGNFEKSFEAFKNALLLDESNVIVRQNFLYLAQRIKKESPKSVSSEKQKAAVNRDAQKKEADSDDPDGEKDKKNRQPGKYHFSDKEMNDMLQQAKEKVRVPQGTKSKNNQQKNNALDY
jgi:tetratricopeptide (TPR) repeat protein